MESFDLAVIGAGPGGYVAAIRAAQLGLRVALIEKEASLGGTCLNVGCIPSKALLESSELYYKATHAFPFHGITTGPVSIDLAKMMARKDQVVEELTKGIGMLMKKNKITEVDGWGTLTSPTSMDVELNDGGTQQLTYDNLIIATGAYTRLVPGTELSERVVTYEEQILTDELPGSIVIAGSGAIGVEFAYVLANFGVEVTIVEFLDRIVPLEDPEVSKELAKQYKKLGVTLMTSTKVEKIDDSGDKVKVTVSPADGGDSQTLETDKVMQAIGFVPRVEGYGLEDIGVELTDRGAAEERQRLETDVDHDGHDDEDHKDPAGADDHRGNPVFLRFGEERLHSSLLVSSRSWRAARRRSPRQAGRNPL